MTDKKREESKVPYDPQANMIGGFSENDGTIDFYLRINSLLQDNFVVLDFGAGRGAWYEDDACATRTSIRLLKGKVRKVIAADVDQAVLGNKASDEQLLLQHGNDLDCLEHSVDLIVADYVLEHIRDAALFFEEVDRCLKPGGWFCARTPHKFSYVAIFARMVQNKLHAKVINFIQPNRKEIDVFPTHYELNTLQKVQRHFNGWENRSFIFRSDPAYFFGNQFVYGLQKFIHKLLPRFISGNLFIFIRKP